MRLFLLALGLFLQACSVRPILTQPGTWFRSSAEVMQIRLLDVAYPLLTAAADWCPFDQEPTYGFLLRDEAGGAGTAAHSPHGRVLVSYVHPRLPAAVAGLSVNDVMLAVNTVTVLGDSADQVGRLINRLTHAKIQPLQLEVVHGTERRTVTLSAIPACHYTMQVLPSDLINGITDGRQIGVTRGALRFFSSDDDLGWIVAHEIAHNILHHAQNEKFQVMMRTFLGAMGASDSASVDKTPPRRSIESQADYVGAYLMARAGYDLEAVRRVWKWLERIETLQTRQGSELAQAHPPTKERLAAFESTLHEIETARRTGRPLQILLKENTELSP